jgi:TolA-binding protein
MRNVSGFRLWAVLGLLCALMGPPVATALAADPIDDYNTSLKLYEQKRWDFAARGFAAFLEAAPEHPKAALAQLYQGQALTHSQKYAEARTVFREFLKNHAEHPDAALAAYRVGESSYFLNEFPAAAAELEAFVTKYPEHDLAIWGWQYLGEAQLQSDKAAEAVKSFEKVLSGSAATSEQLEAKFFLARAYEALREGDKATAIFQELAASTHPRAAEALFSLAALDYQSNQFAKAAAGFEQMITRFPTHALVSTAELNAGYAHYKADEFAKAETHFVAATQKPELSNSANFWVGMCRKSQKKWVEAIEVFTDLAAKVPSGELAEKVTYHWADCESRRDRFAEARRLYESIATRWPSSVLADDAHYSAADCAVRAGDVAGGIALAQDFAVKHPTSPLKQLNDIVLGRALLARGDAAAKADTLSGQDDFQQAVALFRGVVNSSKVPRTSMQARIQWARAEKRLRNFAAVVEALNPVSEAIAKGEAGSADMVEVLPMLGEALLQTGQAAEAEAVLERALQSLPATADRRQSLMMLTEVRAVQKRWPEMFEALDQLKAADKDGVLTAQAAYRNAEHAIAAKSLDQATQLLTRVVDMGETTDYYAAALTELGKVQAEQQQFAAAALSYQKLLESTVSDPVVLATAAYNRGVCLEKDAGNDSQKLALAADALEQGVQRFAIPKERALPDDTELRAARFVIRSARLAASIRMRLITTETPAAQVQQLASAADQLWTTASEQIAKLPPDEQALETPDVMLYEWAAQLFNAGNRVRADEIFSQLYQTYPASEHADDAKLYVAQGFDEDGKADEARALYKSLQDDVGAEAKVKLQGLVSWLNLEARVENWSESERLSDLIIQAYPGTAESLDARFRRAESLLQKRSLGPAVAALTELRADPATSNASWKNELELLWAEAKFEEKDYDSVRTAMNALVAAGPDALIIDQAHLLLGRADLKEAMFAEARVHLKSVVDSPTSAKSPLAARAQLAIADTFLAEKKLAEAVQAYTDVYANYPFPEHQSAALLQVGRIDVTEKKWEQADASLNLLIKDFPNSPEAVTAKSLLVEVQKNLPAKP